MLHKHIHHFRPILLVIGLLILCGAIVVMVQQTFTRGVPSGELPEIVQPGAKFTLSSPIFETNGAIPDNYTCTGTRITPPLFIENPPSNTKEFALIVRDTTNQNKTHWVVWNIPSTTTLIPENVLPKGAVQGTNDFNAAAYEPLCSPVGGGTHQYSFELYALSDSVVLESTGTDSNLIATINGKIISKAQASGSVAPEAPKTDSPEPQ